MRPLLSMVRWDFILNFRQGIVFAALWVMILWSIMLTLVPDQGLVQILISLMFLEVSIFALYLLPSFYYLEKAERVLDSVVATPLPSWIWLVSKTIVFTLQTLAISAAIVLVAYGPHLHWGWFLLAIILSGMPLLLIGFAVAARFNGISEYLFPSIPVLLVLQLPLLSYWQIWTGSFWWLFPTMPGMVLLEAAFPDGDRERIPAALILGLLYLVPSFWLAWQRYQISVVRRAGA